MIMIMIINYENDYCHIFATYSTIFSWGKER